MTVQATETSKKGLLSGLLSGGKAIWVAALALALIAVFGALTILGNAAATQTYYVLARDIPARTQITPDMLTALEAKVDHAPPTAMDAAAVASGEVFSQIALKAGDIVSTSNAGPLTRITEDVPKDFVAASFSAQPEIAVAGKVRKGDHIDLIASNDEGASGARAQVVLQHVLVLDVTVSPESIAEAANSGQEGQDLGSPGPESEAVRSGIPTVYTVAVSPTDATKLALARGYDLYVVLSGNVPEQDMFASSSINDLFNGRVADSSAGTASSVFALRYDHAFEVGNVWVDNEQNVWKVNDKKQWVKNGKTTLKEGEVPPGYLPLPTDAKFIDGKGVLWISQSEDGVRVWKSETGKALDEGVFPDGFDPRQQFKNTSDEDAN